LEFVRSEIEKVEALKKEEYLLNRAGEEARQLLGAILWKDGQADWSRLEQLRAWSDTFVRTAAQIAGVDLERMRVLRETWSRLLTEGDAARGPDGAVYRVLGEYCSTYEDFLDSIREVEAKATLDPAQAWSDPALSDFLDDTSNRLQGFIDDLPALQAWCNWRRVREDALKLNLNAIVSAYEDGQFPTSEVERVVLRAFYEWWVDGIVEAEPVLRDFFGPEHDRKIAVFRELDTQYTELSKQQIRAFLSSKVPSIRGEVADTSEVGILLRQQGRRRGIMPIRKLFQKIPNLLWRLKPCLLMSPLSVAQYLDPSYPQFDLVVFDEASQIPVWDAVGAIARGKEVIVVGDSKQLPPTSFFNRSDDPEDFEDESAVDLESILDDCVAARLPCHELDWHYRSRHESLISFSNHQYYGNRLLTFPSPHREIGVSWKPVPGGVYDRAGARVNKAEAEAIVSEVRRRLLDQEASKFTIGIVTFSIAQQRLIEDLLDAERRKEPEIDPFFSDDLAEPVFVKNLENVQGDERDVILFSICYGPDVTGRVAMNFGPLNKEGGERRLNVAITRARRELLVFSTLRADQIDLSRTRARGVWDLKKFLDYAERGEAALLEASGPSENADFESPFEKDVCEALRSRGYEVHLQVGCSGYRIDLAVVDPDKPGHYLLGVECDGASYHSAKTARDRDRLRQAVLSDLGWHLFRVWSSDWWNNREATLSKIEAAIEAAKVEEPISPAPEPQGSLFAAAPRLLENPVKGFDERQLSTVPRFDESEPIEDAARRPYELCSPLPTIGQKNDFYKVRSNSAMTEAIKYVVRKEGPINLELCARKVIECWGLKRLTPAVLDRIRERIPSQVVRSQVCSYGTFLWPKEMVANDLKCYRAPESPGDFTRSAEEIPPEEVANAAAEVLAHQVAMPMSSLVKETSLLFGFKRVGPIVDHVMEEGIQLLLSSGRAVHNGENIISV
jgi:very-short-patch-repair endonuclease